MPNLNQIWFFVAIILCLFLHIKTNCFDKLKSFFKKAQVAITCAKQKGSHKGQQSAFEGKEEQPAKSQRLFFDKKTTRQLSRVN